MTTRVPSTSIAHACLVGLVLAAGCPGDGEEATQGPGTEVTTVDATTATTGMTTATTMTTAGTETSQTESTSSATSTSDPSTSASSDTETDSDAGTAGSTGDDTSTPLNRVTDGLAVLYRFNAAGGTTVQDVSGVGAPLHLNVTNAAAVTWGTNTLVIESSVRLAGAVAPDKIVTACQASDELTLELWVRAANGSATNAVIMTLSTTMPERAFTVRQNGGAWEFLLNTSMQSVDGLPAITVSGDVTSMSHVVYTRGDAGGGEVEVYVNGALATTDARNGGFATWPAGMAFSLANENTNVNPFLGEFGLAAVYCRVLTSGEITQNFDAGF
jgi:hypothetical protein